MQQTILKKVVLSKQIRPADFLRFMPARQKKELLKQASYLQGKRVVHINAVSDGGGVAEILASLIPYLRSLGVKSDWYFINPSVGKRFFEVTNKIHDALQGAPVKISGREWAEYERASRRIAAELGKIDCDVLVINDPQPLLAGHLAHCPLIAQISRFDVWKNPMGVIQTFR
ncbi:hypothetical protein KKC16_03400 [Patescibacteria group bacterium]|nr:hypothetical protein [Patescibacteria group bacterium]